jgi:hypothetical protein
LLASYPVQHKEFQKMEKMENLKYIVIASALLFSGVFGIFGVAAAGTVSTLNIQTGPGLATEVLLPPGVRPTMVTASNKYYGITLLESGGKGVSRQDGIAIIQKGGHINSDIILNGSNGKAYVIWTHSRDRIPAKVVYKLH